MRLLNLATLDLEEYPDDQPHPQYVAISHLWGPEEITYDDIVSKSEAAKAKPGYTKILKVRDLIRDFGISHMYIDVCCLKPTTQNSTEASHATNSFFKWFAGADFVIALLRDVSNTGEQALRLSRWFTRRWILMEFLAARKLLFYNKNWVYLGSRDDENIKPIIQDITQIEPRYWEAHPTKTRRQLMNEASIGERWQWASRKLCTRPEDIAYSMLGIFNVNMPISYGEGEEATSRLGIILINRVVAAGPAEYPSLLGWLDAVWLATKLSRADLVHFLLEANSSPDASDWKRWAALHFAANTNLDDIVGDLLRYGADANLQNEQGETPLHLAAKQGNVNIITLLLQYAADASITTRRGKIAREYATAQAAKDLFAAPPIVEWRIVGHGRRERLQLPPKPLTDDERNICEDFLAQVLFFGDRTDSVSQEITPTVYDLIYKDNYHLQQPKLTTFKWIHLPLNHVSN